MAASTLEYDPAKPQPINWTVLHLKNRDFISSMAPTLTYLAFLVITGLVGNSVVFFVYYKKFKASVTRTYILALSVADLMVNVLVFPADLLRLRFYYTFNNVIGCQTAGAITHFAVVFSGLILVAVALERRRKICQPANASYVITQPCAALLLCVLVAVLLTVPYTYHKGPRNIETGLENITGVTCSFVESHANSASLVTYKAFAFVTFASCVTVMMASYAQIAWRLRSHRVRRNRVQRLGGTGNHRLVEQRGIAGPCSIPSAETQDFNSENEVAQPSNSQSVRGEEDTINTASFKSCSSLQNNDSPANYQHENLAAELSSVPLRNVVCEHCRQNDTCDCVSDAQSGNVEIRLAGKINEHAGPVSHELVHGSERKELFPTSASSCDLNSKREISPTYARCSKRHPKEIPTRTTLMLFALTVLFVINYLPSLTSGLLLDEADLVDAWNLNLYHIAYRSTRVNSAINAFVYSFFSLRFRRECRRLFCCLVDSL